MAGTSMPDAEFLRGENRPLALARGAHDAARALKLVAEFLIRVA